MLIKMKLQNGPFESIKKGIKTIEIRLNDEKRSQIKIGDEIEFTNMLNDETISVFVINLHYFNTFEELFNYFDKKLLGYENDEIASYTDMEKYYSKEEQAKYGVVGIEIKLKV